MTEILPFKRSLRPQDLVLRFLNSPGHKRDAEFYLNLFASSRPESFALVVLDEDVLREEVDAVLFEIRYLMRLSLFPVVMIRSSSDFLEKIDLEGYFKKAGIGLNFLSNDYSNDEKLEFIKVRIRQQSLPLVHITPGLDMIQEIVNLANNLHSCKIIFLRRSGGILNEETQAHVPIVNLRLNRQEVVASNKISDHDAAFIELCEHIINKCPHKVIISIVSPNNLLRELFTVKGAGTLIQRGSRIFTRQSWEGIDPNSLKRLLEASFERPIRPEFFNEPFDFFYIEENYMGAALLKKYNDLFYLSKFAVGTEARGLGIGRDLWGEILNNHKRFFWRSRADKFITHWYTKQCDGMHKTPEWTIFWKGLDHTQINDAIEYALKQPVDFA